MTADNREEGESEKFPVIISFLVVRFISAHPAFIYSIVVAKLEGAEIGKFLQIKLQKLYLHFDLLTNKLLYCEKYIYNYWKIIENTYKNELVCLYVSNDFNYTARYNLIYVCACIKM